MNTGIRFDIIVLNLDGTTKEKLVYKKEIFKENVSYSEINYEVHKARLKYGYNNVTLRPTFDYSPEMYGFNL